MKTIPGVALSSGQQQLEGRTLAGRNKVVCLLGPAPDSPPAVQPDNCLSGALRLEDRKLMLDCSASCAKLPVVARESSWGLSLATPLCLERAAPGIL